MSPGLILSEEEASRIMDCMEFMRIPWSYTERDFNKIILDPETGDINFDILIQIYNQDPTADLNPQQIPKTEVKVGYHILKNFNTIFPDILPFLSESVLHKQISSACRVKV